MHFTSGANDIHMQMGQSGSNRQSHGQHDFGVHSAHGQEVEEGTVLMKISHQPKLCPCAIICNERNFSFSHSHRRTQSFRICKLTFIVSCNKSEDIFMTQHDRLIDFCFAKPRAFLSTRKYFHCNEFTAPTSSPHLAEPSLSNHFNQLNLTGDRTLNQ